jgi:hypothetical protein
VLRGASEQIAEGVLRLDILYSLYRVIAGFLLGAAVAILVGCASGSVRLIEDFLDPVIEMLRPIPPLAWLPLFIFWSGIGELPKIYFTAFVAFFPVYVNTIEGVKFADPLLRRAALSLAATGGQMFTSPGSSGSATRSIIRSTPCSSTGSSAGASSGSSWGRRAASRSTTSATTGVSTSTVPITGGAAGSRRWCTRRERAGSSRAACHTTSST